MSEIFVDGSGSVVGDAIAGTTLGGEYLGWTGFYGWKKQAEFLGIQHFRWPAGINAEDRVEANGYAFDLSTPTLVDNWPKNDGASREGLAEMFAYANANDASFSMIVPTGRYVGLMSSDPDAAKEWIQSDVEAFTTRLFSGEFGEIPPDFLLEIGAEYYSTDAWIELSGDPDAEAVFASVFAELVAALRDAELSHGNDVYSIAVQAARFQSWDDTPTNQDGELADSNDFLEAYAAQGVSDAIDAIIWHRYVYMFSQTGHHLTAGVGEHTLSDHLALWESALGHPLDLVVSWAAPDIDRDGEFPASPFFDFGPRASQTMLQMFSELTEAGMDYATVYGIDVQWTGALSTGTSSANDFFVSFHGAVYAMMAESLGGLWATDAFHSNSVTVDENNSIVPNDHVNIYGFSDGYEEQVTFAAAWDLAANETVVRFASSEFQTNFVTIKHLKPEHMEPDASGEYVLPQASLRPDGTVSVHDVSDFDVVRVTHTSEIDVGQAMTTNISLASGRELAVLSEGADNFALNLAATDRIVHGRAGDDVVSGTSEQDVILGGEGGDLLFGGGGGDILVGDDLLADSILDWLDGNNLEFI